MDHLTGRDGDAGHRSNDGRGASRRRLLRAAGGAIAAVGAGATTAAGATGGSAPDDAPGAADLGADCPDATFEPNMTHYDHSIEHVCEDGDYETRELQYRVRGALESRFPTVGSLIDDGFVPYFDFFAEDATWSHWLHPAYVGDDRVLDPARPESLLVDHEYWRPMGVMFIATPNGERLDPPPSAYAAAGGECKPWHAHVGFPGRYAWAKFRAAYAEEIEWPCRTPWMMHVWNYADENVYAHGAPDDRGGAPAEPAGFETDADPTAEPLAPEHLPDALRERCEERWGGVADRWGDAWTDAWDEGTEEDDDEDDSGFPWSAVEPVDTGRST